MNVAFHRSLLRAARPRQGRGRRRAIGALACAAILLVPAVTVVPAQAGAKSAAKAKKHAGKAVGRGHAKRHGRTVKAVGRGHAKPAKVHKFFKGFKASQGLGIVATTTRAPSTTATSTTATATAARAARTAHARRVRAHAAAIRRAERRAAVRRHAARARAARFAAAQQRLAGSLGVAALTPALAGGAATPAAAPAARPVAHHRPRHHAASDSGTTDLVTRTVRDIAEVVPGWVWAALGGLAGLSLLLLASSLLGAARSRRLERQRRELLQEVGLLQGALLPTVPATLGALRTSVAYRPAEGPGAGGDFYDALPLSGGRAGLILGDVSGHGRRALGHTAFMRYTLRAYLEAGLEPRIALQVAGRVIEGHLGSDFATVLLAVHDPQAGTLTYAAAGHPAPIVTGSASYDPVPVGAAPPLGVGLRTGVRQSSLPLPPGSLACLYTDGLSEARTEAGILGRPRLADLVAELGPDATAEELLEAVAHEATSVPDDMAVCLVRPASAVTAGGFRTEQIELDQAELATDLPPRFLSACGVPAAEAAQALEDSHELAGAYGGVVLTVTYAAAGRRATVMPRNVESIEAASLEAAAASS